MDIKTYMQTVGRQARSASRSVAAASTDAKNKALLAMAAEIRAAPRSSWTPTPATSPRPAPTASSRR